MNLIGKTKYFQMKDSNDDVFVTDKPFCAIRIRTLDLIDLLTNFSTTLEKEIGNLLTSNPEMKWDNLDALAYRIAYEIRKQLYRALIEDVDYTAGGITIIFNMKHYVAGKWLPFFSEGFRSYWHGELLEPEDLEKSRPSLS